MKYNGKYSLKHRLNEATGTARSKPGGDFEEVVRARRGGVGTGGSSHGHDVQFADGTGLETKTTAGGTIQIHITHHPTHAKQMQAEVINLGGGNDVATIRQALQNCGLDEDQAAADILANYEKKKGQYIETSHHGVIKMSDLVHSSWGSLGGGAKKFGPVYRIPKGIRDYSGEFR